MRVKARRYMYYNKRGYNAGEEYEMDDREESEARILSILGNIDIVEASRVRAPKYQTAEVKAEEEKPAPITTESPFAGSDRRQYRRRDMKAEK